MSTPTGHGDPVLDQPARPRTPKQLTTTVSFDLTDTGLLADLGLQPKQAKTRIVHLTDGGEGLDFLGFHHRLVHSRPVHGTSQFTFLARWPSRKAMQHARDRIGFVTMRSGACGSAGRDGQRARKVNWLVPCTGRE